MNLDEIRSKILVLKSRIAVQESQVNWYVPDVCMFLLGNSPCHICEGDLKAEQEKLARLKEELMVLSRQL